MNTTHRILFALLAALATAQAQPYCIQADNEMTVGTPPGSDQGYLSSGGTSYYLPACNEIYYIVNVTVPGGLHLPGPLFIGGDFDQHPADALTCASASITVVIWKRSGGAWKFFNAQNMKGAWQPNGSYCHLTDPVYIPTPPANETDQYQVWVLPEQQFFLGPTPEPARAYWGVQFIT